MWITCAVKNVSYFTSQKTFQMTFYHDTKGPNFKKDFDSDTTNNWLHRNNITLPYVNWRKLVILVSTLF